MIQIGPVLHPAEELTRTGRLRCPECGRPVPHLYELAGGFGRLVACDGCMHQVKAMIVTEFSRPHLRGVGGDTRTPLPPPAPRI